MKRLIGLAILLAAASALLFVSAQRRLGDRPLVHQQIIVPEEDRFTPFGITIRVGDTVIWTNYDTDDHTIVSDDFLNTAGNNGTNVLLVGTDNNHGVPGTFMLNFPHPGQWIYYCRFHSHLDHDHQPKAPGPDGGIEDKDGNFGTPMMGVITVLPQTDKD